MVALRLANAILSSRPSPGPARVTRSAYLPPNQQRRRGPSIISTASLNCRTPNSSLLAFNSISSYPLGTQFPGTRRRRVLYTVEETQYETHSIPPYHSWYPRYRHSKKVKFRSKEPWVHDILRCRITPSLSGGSSYLLAYDTTQSPGRPHRNRA